MTINKSIDILIDSLQELKKLDLSNSLEPKNDEILLIHSKIKETQKKTSMFQQEISPFQKKLNRKRIEYLKKKGRDPKNLTKSELIQELEQLKLQLENRPKE